MASEYGVKMFNARKTSLHQLAEFLGSYLNGTLPIRRPSITAIVLPPKERRDESLSILLSTRRGAAGRMGINEYGEIFAFDDGAMPKYELRQLPGKPVPFYGLQDVTAIDLPAGATEEQILEICRTRCRSDHFVLLDQYREIKDTFMLGAAMSAESNMASTDGYRIFKKHP